MMKFSLLVSVVNVSSYFQVLRKAIISGRTKRARLGRLRGQGYQRSISYCLMLPPTDKRHRFNSVSQTEFTCP